MREKKVASVILAFVFLSLCLAQAERTQRAADPKEEANDVEFETRAEAVRPEKRREALIKLEDDARVLESSGQFAAAARALNSAGRLRLLLSEPKETLATHLRALTLLEIEPSVEVEADNLNGLGAAQIYLLDLTGAEESVRRALELSESSGYLRGKAEAYFYLAERRNHVDHAQALKTAQDSLSLWQSLGDLRWIARAQALTGRCFMAQNLLTDAGRHYEEALRIWRELKDENEQAGALIMLGFIEHRRGEWQTSISLLAQAESFLDETTEPHRSGQVAAGLAEAFNENGLPEIGLTHFKRALEFYRRAQSPYSISYALWGIGSTQHLLGNDSDALQNLAQALEGIERDGPLAALIYEYTGRIRSAKGEQEEALRSLREALAVYERAGNPREAARARALIGQAQYVRGERVEARRNLKRALEVFVALSDKVNEAAVQHALGRIELKEGNYRAAEVSLRRAIEATEEVRRAPTGRDLTAAFSSSVQNRYESYVECLMRLHRDNPEEGFDARAFEASELARARSLSELLRDDVFGVVPGIDADLAAREKFLRQLLREKENEKIDLLSKDYRKDELEALQSKLTSLDAELVELEETIKERHPSYEQITRPAAWNVRRIQEEVVADEQTALLEYSLGSERSYLWVVTREEFKSFELPSRARINEAARSFYEAISVTPKAGPDERLDSAGRELSRMILSPAAQELGKARLIVVADGVLNYIPFQTLPMPSSPESEPLVAGNEIANAPSASILGQLREARAGRQAPTKVLAAFGDPVFESNYAERKDEKAETYIAKARHEEGARLQTALRDIELKGDSSDVAINPLFYARRELANLKELTGDGEAFVAEGFNATRERLQMTDLNGYAILHFATHGLLDPVRPENSGLILSTVTREGESQEGFVGLEEIYSLRAGVDLVVLSACRTGLGKDVRGEGLIGLTRGFMYAGASSVVSSLWKVDDEATAELMKRFYANMLLKEMTPAAALRDAQNSVRRETQWSSPFYWAAFTLQGEYRNTIKTAKAIEPYSYRNKFAIIAGLSILCGCFALWIYFRRHRKA